MNKNQLLLACLFFLFSYTAFAKDYRTELNNWLATYEQTYPTMGNFKVVSIKINTSQKTYQVYTNKDFSFIPFRPQNVAKMLHEIDSIIAPTYPNYKITLYADGDDVDDLIPNAYRKKKDAKRMMSTHNMTPLVTNKSLPYKVSKGLQNRHIALWQSHGLYYDQKTDRWHWQRARLLTTVEDKYTQSYVLPYLVPMLQNAGANVLLPRERDTQTNEVIVDNDTSTNYSLYKESTRKHQIESGGSAGFADRRKMYVDDQNPFIEGTYRIMKASLDSTSEIEWIPNIPDDGEYAVYVSYRTKEKSIPDAHYTVFYDGGETHFTVNQRMGGGTWIYLGTFYFKKGLNKYEGKVTLSNYSKHEGEVTADAVRFGGGMGNIGRRPADSTILKTAQQINPDKDYQLLSSFQKDSFQISGFPRYLEGARYWLQWAGAPDSVYSYMHGLNDYTDDYTSRANWVNWLNNGSYNAPDSVGLGIPIDLSLAFHSDAGILQDTVVGTLGIFTSLYDKENETDTYPNGKSRYIARDLADMVETQIVDDIRVTYDSSWTIRGIWNKNYYETRAPRVPAMILEVLSHQNYDDMIYGLDPRFKFLVSRAVYKGILKYLSEVSGKPYVVQPLPVNRFALKLHGDSIRLSWHPVRDSLEPTATPKAYIIYSRTEDGGFDNGIFVKDTIAILPLKKNVLMSYKVAAVNAGGIGFPSETLSACNASKSKRTVLVVNGFERISGPEGFSAGGYAGFPDWLDAGVPDKYNISYTGKQYDFLKTDAWVDDDCPGWGASYFDKEKMKIAGNSFDYSIVHGRALVANGYSFVSCSAAAVEDSIVLLSNYKIVDLILGLQKQCYLGKDSTSRSFKTFPEPLQNQITGFLNAGGALFASGAYIGTDLWHNGEVKKSDQRFAQNMLHYTWRTDHACTDGNVSAVYSPFKSFKGNLTYADSLNEKQYAVFSPDGIEPYGDNAYTIMRYKQNNISAAVAYKGSYRTVICGFPFEALTNGQEREKLMHEIMRFLTK